MDPLTVAIALYFLAILLAVIDIFVPSGGILLILSGVAAIGAIVFGFRAGTTTGLVVSVVVLASIPALLYSAIKLWPHTPIGRRILLEPPTAAEAMPENRLTVFIGTVVVSRWPLVPMGQIKIGTQRLNARTSDGKIIEIGQRVKVIDVQEGLLVVQETTEPISENFSSAKSAQSSSSTVAANTELEGSNLLEQPAAELGLNDLDDLKLDEDR